MLGCIGVSLTIKGTPVLTGVSFALQPGGCVVIEGPSGSGKTQLVRLLLREMDPTGGAIEVDGVNLKLLPPQVLQLYRQRVGTVFQDALFLPSLTIAENVALPAVLRTHDERSADAAARNMLTTLGIADIADATLTNVPAGALRLACIARALCGNPSIVICDEPFAALDDAQRERVLAALQAAHDKGTSVLILTQHAAQAATLGGTTVRLQGAQPMAAFDVPSPSPVAATAGNVRITPIGR